MKPTMIKSLSFVLVVCLLALACTKEKDPAPTPTPNPLPPAAMDREVSSLFDDNSMVADQLNELAIIATKAIESCEIFAGHTAMPFDICGADVTITNGADVNTARVFFSNANCPDGKYSRTGTMIITGYAGDQWKNRRVGVSISFDDLRITRKADGKTITFNRELNFSNTSGGLFHLLSQTDTIGYYLATSDLSITFDNGEERRWNVSHRLHLKKDGGLIVHSEGLENIGGQSMVSIWGNDRSNKQFTLSTPTPLLVKEACNYRITMGELSYRNDELSSVVRFGLDEEGNATPCPGTGNYFCDVNWQRSGSDSTFNTILPY